MVMERFIGIAHLVGLTKGLESGEGKKKDRWNDSRHFEREQERGSCASRERGTEKAAAV